MLILCRTITDLAADSAALRRGRYGVIEVAEGQLQRIVLRPLPKHVYIWQSRWWGQWQHRRRAGDYCRLFYNQPLKIPDFLAVTYAVSSRHTTFATIRRALDVLDEIARLKGTDALLCDASNLRISERALARWGWQPHAPMRWRRNFIKRLNDNGECGMGNVELENRQRRI